MSRTPDGSPLGAGRAASAALLALVLAVPAAAYIPPAEKVIDAVAKANRLAGRAHALRLEVVLVRGEDEELASGELLSDSRSAARLELRADSGLVERHLLLGDVYRASRNGIPLPAPRLFLPPLFSLQASSGDRLRMALVALGAGPDAIALGSDRGTDCYVLGGRSLGGSGEDAGRTAALWVDMQSFEPVRIDVGGGVHYRLGPLVEFGSLRLPSWIAIEIPEQPDMQLLVRGAAPTDAIPAAFGAGWLRGPVAPGSGLGQRFELPSEAR